jgi:hypothetical protein
VKKGLNAHLTKPAREIIAKHIPVLVPIVLISPSCARHEGMIET